MRGWCAPGVRELLDLYGVTDAEREGLIQLAREARQPGWWHSFRDVLPNPYEVYIGLETGATSIRNFEPVGVPGLLQTADYARAMFRGGARELGRERSSAGRSPPVTAAGPDQRAPAAAVGGHRRSGNPPDRRQCSHHAGPVAVPGRSRRTRHDAAPGIEADIVRRRTAREPKAAKRPRLGGTAWE